MSLTNSDIASYGVGDFLPALLVAQRALAFGGGKQESGNPIAEGRAADPGLVIKHKKAHGPKADPDMEQRIREYEKMEFAENRAAFRKLSHPQQGPLVYIKVLGRDVVVTRKLAFNSSAGGGKRGAITHFSRKAIKNMVLAARNTFGFKTLLTLTYPSEYPTDGKLVKYHWKKMKQWLIRRGLKGFWFLEFQKRGAPHFHVFMTGKVSKDEVRAFWYKVVGSGDSKHLRAGTRIESIRKEYAAAAYVAKYAKKAEQKEVPEEYQNVGRFWGMFGGLRPDVYTVTGGENTGENAEKVRLLRKLYNAHQKREGFPTKKDKGRVGFTLWGLTDKEGGDVISIAEGGIRGLQYSRAVGRMHLGGARSGLP